jgi:hypothetical protein
MYSPLPVDCWELHSTRQNQVLLHRSFFFIIIIVV